MLGRSQPANQFESIEGAPQLSFEYFGAQVGWYSDNSLGNCSAGA